MFPLRVATADAKRLEVLCIGAHCDDIEIGCGGTLLSLQQAQASCRIHWFILTSAPDRRSEAMAAVEALVLPAARGEIRVCELPDGLLPAHFADVKKQFEDLKHVVEPDIVFTHHGGDLHQDHRLVSEVTWQTFRNHMIWEYEIAKFEGDLATPNMYMPLSASVAATKVDLIVRSFPSQSSRSWFSAENFLALMRLRGLESRADSGLAEGFHCRKLVGSWGGET